MWLFQGALTFAGLYLVKELRELETDWPNFHYVRSVLRESDQPGVEREAEVGPLDHCILERFPSLAGWKGYVCGDPLLVNSLRKKLFLSGMASKAIYADAFLPSVT